MILIKLPYCLAFNALAYRAYTAREGKGDVAMPSALIDLLFPSRSLRLRGEKWNPLEMFRAQSHLCASYVHKPHESSGELPRIIVAPEPKRAMWAELKFG
jgi:hypothetical protein